MRKKVQNIIVFAVLVICNMPVLAQLSQLPVPNETTEKNKTTASDTSKLGIWENASRFVEITKNSSNSLDMKITLKLFYEYYYDDKIESESHPNYDSIAKIGDGLYLEYWTKGSAFDAKQTDDGIYWRPSGNLEELSIDQAQMKKELTAYYVYTGSDTPQIFEIRYWIANLEYAKEYAGIELEKDENTHLTLLVDKYLKINGIVYTCATGRRTIIRNVKMLTTLPSTPVYSEDKRLMVLDSPYLVKSEIKDVDAEIESHNAIIYPPHSGEATFEEPSVYEKMENGELPLNGGSYFKPDTLDE